jgi:hypothetical protein
VFATLGKAGSIAMADTEAIGRLISLALRFGIPVSEVHQQLRGISSDRAIGFGRTRCSRCRTPSRRRSRLREQEKAGIQQELIPEVAPPRGGPSGRRGVRRTTAPAALQLGFGLRPGRDLHRHLPGLLRASWSSRRGA